ncbi:hypothetical protein CPB84DRAFT_1848997 [Gymnopilus junonius]|uniref:Uncharacterized protein n=1 Tax=Gymnopilus junonius TaxID=109634 RepID=A0A9P5NIS2_GYMJU|nr:hypothetical protein CPB84DRAFT_1848997 [Gymnopilus junonius]
MGSRLSSHGEATITESLPPLFSAPPPSLAQQDTSSTSYSLSTASSVLKDCLRHIEQRRGSRILAGRSAVEAFLVGSGVHSCCRAMPKLDLHPTTALSSIYPATRHPGIKNVTWQLQNSAQPALHPLLDGSSSPCQPASKSTDSVSTISSSRDVLATDRVEVHARLQRSVCGVGDVGEGGMYVLDSAIVLSLSRRHPLSLRRLLSRPLRRHPCLSTSSLPPSSFSPAIIFSLCPRRAALLYTQGDDPHLQLLVRDHGRHQRLTVQMTSKNDLEGDEVEEGTYQVVEGVHIATDFCVPFLSSRGAGDVWRIRRNVMDSGLDYFSSVRSCVSPSPVFAGVCYELGTGDFDIQAMNAGWRVELGEGRVGVSTAGQALRDGATFHSLLIASQEHNQASIQGKCSTAAALSSLFFDSEVCDGSEKTEEEEEEGEKEKY